MALASGLSGLVSSSSLVIAACLALSFAGAVTMTTGGYLEGKKYATRQQALFSALTIGLGYLLGGVFIILPFAIWHVPSDALPYSVTFTLFLLLISGYFEGRLNNTSGWGNAIRVALTASIAAAAAHLIARLFA